MATTENAEHVLFGLVVTCAVFIALNTIFLILRFISRLFVQEAPFGYDDILTIPAFFFNIGICAVGLVMARIEAAGNPSADETFMAPELFETHLKPALKCIFALSPLFVLGYGFPKLSLLHFYLRVFVSQKFRVAVFFLMGINVLEMISFIIVSIFYCYPVEFFWMRTGRGSCINIDAFYRIASGLKVLVDIAIILLPIRPLWKLQAPKPRKLGLIFVFSTTLVGLVGCIIRWIFFFYNTAVIITPRLSARLISVTVLEPKILRQPGLRRKLGLSTLQSFKRPAYVDAHSFQKQTKGGDGFEHLVEDHRDLHARMVKRTGTSVESGDDNLPASIPLHEITTNISQKPNSHYQLV